MKKQIKRLSPHQNGKVFGVLLGIASLIFLLPMFVFMLFVMPEVDAHGNRTYFPMFMIILFPVLYLIFGYVSTAIGSALYNFLFKYVGGFEFEVEDTDA